MTIRISKRVSFGLGTALAALVLAASPACAEPAQAGYDMPAQPLGLALSRAAERAGVTIIAPTPLVEGLRAPALKGSYGPEEAIRRLLDGSGLVLERVGESYVIKRAVRGEGETAGDLAGKGEGDSSPDIVVTGSRIRGAPVASTLVRLQAEAIRNSGQSTVVEALKSLPQNFGGGQNPGMGFNVPESSGTDIGGGSGLNLRGLGPDATLTLLNGHRLPYSAATQGIDVSAIPLDTVEKVDKDALPRLEHGAKDWPFGFAHVI